MKRYRLDPKKLRQLPRKNRSGSTKPASPIPTYHHSATSFSRKLGKPSKPGRPRNNSLLFAWTPTFWNGSGCTVAAIRPASIGFCVWQWKAGLAKAKSCVPDLQSLHPRSRGATRQVHNLTFSLDLDAHSVPFALPHSAGPPSCRTNPVNRCTSAKPELKTHAQRAQSSPVHNRALPPGSWRG